VFIYIKTHNQKGKEVIKVIKVISIPHKVDANNLGRIDWTNKYYNNFDLLK
jgi:hypothetical protein